MTGDEKFVSGKPWFVSIDATGIAIDHLFTLPNDLLICGQRYVQSIVIAQNAFADFDCLPLHTAIPAISRPASNGQTVSALPRYITMME
jgi:hypothetical protein